MKFFLTKLVTTKKKAAEVFGDELADLSEDGDEEEKEENEENDQSQAQEVNDYFSWKIKRGHSFFINDFIYLSIKKRKK